MNIAIIEDNPDIRELFQWSFELDGHVATTFETGEAFFQTYFPEEGNVLPIPFDVLIIDLGLPGHVSGHAILSRLHQKRADEHFSYIVVVTGAGENAIFSVRQPFPTIPILQKPISTSTLLSLVKRCVIVPSRKG